MKDSTVLANRLREIFDGGWIASTNLKEQLEDVTLEMAVTKISELNTIAMLTFHLNYYIKGVLDVLMSGDLVIRDKFSFDLPPINTEDEWTTLKTQLMDNAEAFAKQVELLSKDQLNAVFIKEEYGDFRRSVDGIIEHSYYHFGQITLIKKLILSKES